MDDSDVAQEQIRTSYLPFLVNNLNNLIISQSELDSTTAQATRSSISSSPLPSSAGDSISLEDPNIPEFIEHAYCFLIANIHNPYPTREEKQAIVDKSNSSRVSLISVSNWFINTRRRCGWAEILKRRCGGNREEMISLAKQIFGVEDPDRLVDPQVMAEFMAMKEKVEGMQQKEARTSAWIEDLGRLVNSAPSSNCRESSVQDQRQEKNIRVQTFPMVDKAKRWCDQRNQSDMENVVSSSPSFFLSPSNAVDEDGMFASGSVSSKRKNFHDDSVFYERRKTYMSPALSPFSSTCDLSDGRTPSLSWSDDDERPHKRSRSNISTPITPSPRCRELLLDEPFIFAPPSNLPENPPVACNRGQKRSCTDFDAPPITKRIRSGTIQSALGMTLMSNLPDPIDTTGKSETGTSNIGVAGDNRGSSADSFQLFQSTSNDGMQTETDASDSDVSSEHHESQFTFPLLVAPPQFVPEQSPPPAPLSETSLPDLPIDLFSLELTSLWPRSHPQISLTEPSDLLSDDGALDLNGLMSGLSSTHISTSIPLAPAIQDAVPMFITIPAALNDINATIDLTGQNSALNCFQRKTAVKRECAIYLEKELEHD